MDQTEHAGGQSFICRGSAEMGQLDTRQVCPRILSHYRCSTPSLGDNVRTRPPEYPVKPDTETQEKAKRANKKAFLALVQDQRSHGSQEASDLDFVQPFLHVLAR